MPSRKKDEAVAPWQGTATLRRRYKISDGSYQTLNPQAGVSYVRRDHGDRICLLLDRNAAPGAAPTEGSEIETAEGRFQVLPGAKSAMLAQTYAVWLVYVEAS